LGCGCKNIILHQANFFLKLSFNSPSNGLLNYAMCIKFRLFQTCKA
jgi:hypothetical protein